GDSSEASESPAGGSAGQQRPALDSQAIEQINKELEKKPGLKDKLQNEQGVGKPGNENTGTEAGTKPKGAGGNKAAPKPGETPQSPPGDKEEGAGDEGAHDEGTGNDNTATEKKGTENSTAGQPKQGEKA